MDAIPETAEECEQAGAQHHRVVTFAIFAYNHEQFIEEAVKGAFSQTYQPLEIILSDDQSTDGTFAIMQRMVAEYVGPHRIVLRRNLRNLGVGAHVNAIVDASSGDLIVAAAGDDISMPDRVWILQGQWQRLGRPGSICSMASVIDGKGATIAERYTGYDGQYPESGEAASASLIHYAQNGSRHLLGCSAGWSREVFDTFGNIADDVVNEDNVIGFRSWLLSRVGYIDDVLVQYRTHGTNLYHSSRLKILTSYQDFRDAEAVRTKRARWESAYLRQHLLDLQRAREMSMHDAQTLDRVEGLLRDQLACKDLIAGWDAIGLFARVEKTLALGGKGGRGFRSAQLARSSIPAYCSARYFLRTLAQWRRNAMTALAGGRREREQA